MHERAFRLREKSAHDRQILSYRRVSKKLPDEGVAIALGLCKEENAGGEAVDAVDDERPLPSRSQFGSEQR